MKYIIDIPDTEKDRWVSGTPHGKRLYVPISFEEGKEYHLKTYLPLEDYTEPDRKAIEDAQEKAWELASAIVCPSDCNVGSIQKHCKEIFGVGIWEIRSIFTNNTYQEAKAQYESWKKQKEDEIRVGDELKDDGNIRAVVLDILDVDYENYEVFTENGIVDEWQKGIVVKTGRHFPEVVQLLVKMRGDKE